MKNILIIAVFSTISLVSTAQVQFGAKSGVNLTNWVINYADSNEEDSGVGMKTSFYAGGFVHIPVNEKFSIQPELLFSDQGYKGVDGGVVTKMHTRYVNLPVLAQFRTKFGLYFETGPQVGFLVSANVREGTEEINIKELLKPIDFSWAVGFGYRHTSGIGIDARFTNGLSNISRNDSGKGTITNVAIQVGLFYMFGNSARTTR